MTKLERAVLLRNARIRALRALGVPIAGSWQFEIRDIEWKGTHVPTAWLLLRCGACPPRPRVVRRNSLYANGRTLEECLERMAQIELDKVWQFLHSEHGMDCTHLVPLVGKDSPEVLALTELELLSNG